MGKTDRITTNKLIKSAILCKDCPAKIYQKENAKIKYGKGNLSADYIFVLPINASYIEECEKYLKEVTKDKLDIDLEYITYHPKCAANSPVEGGYDKYCVHYLLHEIRKINPKAVAYNRLLANVIKIGTMLNSKLKIAAKHCTLLYIGIKYTQSG